MHGYKNHKPALIAEQIYNTDAKETIMNILLLVTLCTSPLLHCAADKFITTDQLPNGMWGTKDWPVKAYGDNPKKQHYSELTAHEVRNPFWWQMKDASQKEKDDALLKIVNAHLSDQFYLADRKNIAAATWIGANLLKIKTDQETYTRGILASAFRLNDIPLMSLFFAHKFPVHEERFIFWNARTVDMAKLCIQHGALDNIENFKRSHRYVCPLHYIIAMQYELELITLYRSYGFSPMEIDSKGRTPLEVLFQRGTVSSKKLLKGAVFLLTGLTPIEKIILLTKLHRRAFWGLNPDNEEWEDRSEDQMMYNLNPKTIELTVLLTFLKKTGKQSLHNIKSEKCSVCLKPLDPEYHLTSFTPCYHFFHTRCLAESSVCPYCKKDMPNSFKIHLI